QWHGNVRRRLARLPLGGAVVSGRSRDVRRGRHRALDRAIAGTLDHPGLDRLPAEHRDRDVRAMNRRRPFRQPRARTMKPRGGFTLLELLLSAAMVTMIGLTLYAAMSIGFRARGSAVNQVSAMRAASIAIELLQQDLQSVVPPPVVGEETAIDR